MKQDDQSSKRFKYGDNFSKKSNVLNELCFTLNNVLDLTTQGIRTPKHYNKRGVNMARQYGS